VAAGLQPLLVVGDREILEIQMVRTSLCSQQFTPITERDQNPARPCGLLYGIATLVTSSFAID
jgi:hypothetical protein